MDDSLIFGSRKDIDELIQLISKSFTIKREENLNDFWDALLSDLRK